MSLSNINLYIWKPFSTSPPPPFTLAVLLALNKLILITDEESAKYKWFRRFEGVDDEIKIFLFLLSMIIFGTIGVFVRYIDLSSSEIALLRGLIGS